jgi:hypothetical protein
LDMLTAKQGPRIKNLIHSANVSLERIRLILRKKYR